MVSNYLRQAKKHTLEFLTICLVIIILGFVIASQYDLPQSTNKQVDSDYSYYISKQMEYIKKNYMLTNRMIETALTVNKENRVGMLLSDLLPIATLAENIHLINNEAIQTYDHFKPSSVVDRGTDWFIHASSIGYLSEPYLDPISGSDIISIAYRLENIQSQKNVIVVYDIKLSELIKHIESITGSQLLLGYNNLQRIYSVNGLQNNIDYSSLQLYNSYKVDGSDFVFYEADEENTLELITFISKLPVIIMAIVIIIIFLLYVLKKIYSDVSVFFDHIDDPEYISLFEDLNSIKLAYSNAKKIIENLQHEVDILVTIHQADNTQLEYYKTRHRELLEKLDALKRQHKSNEEKIASIANVAPSFIWMMDASDNITFLNKQLLQNMINIDENQMKISDLLKDLDLKTRLLKKRDYQKIKFRFKNISTEEALEGKTCRIFHNNELKRVLFATNASNFDSKMQYNYLRKSRDLHFINEITKIINNNASMEQTLQEVIDKVAFLGNFNLCTIRLINEQNLLECVAISGYSIEYLYDTLLPLENKHIGKAFNDNKMIVIHTETDVLFPEETIKKILTQGKSLVYLPLANHDRSFGILTIISDFPFNSDILIMLESIAINITISLEKLVLYDQLKANYFKTVEAFVYATEIKSDRFMGHSRRVAEICRAIADRLYLSKNEAEEIFISGLLHDVGKLAYQEDALEEENEHNHNQHGEVGMKMIENVGLSRDILLGIAHHHMDYHLRASDDLTYSEQPYFAQIIRLANDYDVFIHKLEKPFDFSAFFKVMRDHRGISYAPQLFSVLEDIVENQRHRIESIYTEVEQH